MSMIKLQIIRNTFTDNELRHLLTNPYQAHLHLRRAGRLAELCRWVRQLAMYYRLILAIFPRAPYIVNNWRITATALLPAALEHNPVLVPCRAQDPQGLWEVIPHFRSAYVRGVGRKKTFVPACIVRADKLRQQDVNAFRHLLKDYNEQLRPKAIRSGLTIPRISAWLHKRCGTSTLKDLLQETRDEERGVYGTGPNLPRCLHTCQSTPKAGYRL